MGYKQEFFRLGSVAVPLSKKAKKLSWSDIGIIHNQGIWASHKFYKTADTYSYNEKDDLGVELALEQSFDGAEPSVWHLQSGFRLCVGPLREGDV